MSIPLPCLVKVKRALYENSLSLAFFFLFASFLFGQIASGIKIFNQDRRQSGYSELSFSEYLHTGHFGEALFENWESEFLQMGLFVWLAVFFRQKGSSESNPLEPAKPLPYNLKEAPWPVRRGGWALKIYEHSLSGFLFLLFFWSFFMHAEAGLRHYNEEQLLKALPTETLGDFMASPQFWFESFQNWQSEFLSVGVLIVVAIFLREKGSSQSKPVDAPHSQTGEKP